uniref:Large ribosomal subunit protein eL28 n=1 Tax=Pectinaria gouldii TaxID=260746 RepID=A0A0K1QZZ6_PECGU|nr:60S ribosomal L28e [Pectinaria gouldii]
MSTDVQWMVIRNNSSFLKKRRGINQVFTMEPNNLRGRNSLRFNGLVQKNTVGVEAAADGKGIVLVTKKNKRQNRPGSSMNKVTITKSGRPALNTVRSALENSGCRKDLKMAALRRASAILASQQRSKVPKASKSS